MALPDKELLDDLCTRFILNSPPEELASFERLLFLIEQAHWFYEDFAREADPEALLASLSLKRFATLIFGTCPGLQPYSGALDAIYKQFNDYKQAVPVMGAIMLNAAMDKCLLVKSWGSNGAWGFPRGKISTGEADIECARREVSEETGYDLGDQLREEDAIEVHLGQKRTKLYIVPGVDEATHFAPQVRKEISALAWHALAHLPASRDQDAQVFTNDAGGRHKFFMVWNYMRQLRRWIRGRRRAQALAAAASGQAPGGGKAARGGKRSNRAGAAAAAGTPASGAAKLQAASAVPAAAVPAIGAVSQPTAAAATAAMTAALPAGVTEAALQAQRAAQQALRRLPAQPAAQASVSPPRPPPGGASAAVAADPGEGGLGRNGGSGVGAASLGELLARAATAAHASSATGLQGWSAAAAAHPAGLDAAGNAGTAATVAPSPVSALLQQPTSSLGQLAANPTAALSPQTAGEHGSFSSAALTGFQFDRAAILRHLVF